jgi:PhzF family phenazine biosynthesis protein
MRLPIYHVDAFTDSVFGGNPAAVCPLESWLPAPLMQQIALENGLAETAFFVPDIEGYAIRWFTPEIEMDLCGHATLAAAHVLTHHLGCTLAPLRFQSQSGELLVTRDTGRLTLDFPARMPAPAEAPALILAALSVRPREVLKARDYVLVYESEELIRQLTPNLSLLNSINLDPGGICVTAAGHEVDFVSRFFTPQASVFEDPVTGSAHCSLIPYWAQKLGKLVLTARQLSPRGGQLFCRSAGQRVLISGAAVTYLEGVITLDKDTPNRN